MRIDYLIDVIINEIDLANYEEYKKHTYIIYNWPSNLTFSVFYAIIYLPMGVGINYKTIITPSGVIFN